GPTAEILDLEPLADKWRVFGFATAEVDGHDLDALRGVLKGGPLEAGRPTAIICHTVKGKGIGFAEGDANWHHKSKVPPEMAAAARGSGPRCRDGRCRSTRSRSACRCRRRIAGCRRCP